MSINMHVFSIIINNLFTVTLLAVDGAGAGSTAVVEISSFDCTTLGLVILMCDT